MYLPVFFLWCVNLFWTSPAVAAPPIVTIDDPVVGKVLSGAVSCFGWVVGETHPVKEVVFFIDNQAAGMAAGYGGSRSDVAAVFPEIPEAERSGFSAAVNTRVLANGTHTLRVTATNTNGESTTQRVSFEILNLPGNENPSSLTVDLDGAGLQLLSPTGIFVGNLKVNTRPFDTLLEFDPISQHFQLTSLTTAPVLVGAGDIADCGVSGDEATADLLDQIEGTVFTTGDNVYEKGRESEFLNCYEPSWGRHKERTYPSPGNHDYKSSGAAPYFNYFGDKAGPSGRGYYSYDLGAWHIVSLNSNIAAKKGSEQERWLREDLAANPAQCTLAYWHHPVFSSGQHGNDSRMRDIWRVLYEFGADVVLNGHDHDYERFAPQTPDGEPDAATGIREFVVGTGGRGLRGFKNPRPNSEVRDSVTDGVLKLSLHEMAYSWEFVPVAGQTFRDVGTSLCVP